MQRLFGGYTLIEVMLFLAISSVMLAIGIIAVQGQTANTEFRTSVDEINQKFQIWIDQVQNGLSNSTSSASNKTFSCTRASVSGVDYPKLSTSTPVERGANPECIFMGMAIVTSLSTPQNLYSVPIVGLRTDSQGNPSVSIADAHPIAAMAESDPSDVFQHQVDPNVDLVQTYVIPSGTGIYTPATDDATRFHDCHHDKFCSNMAGLFTGINPTSNGSQSLLAVQYPFFQTITGLPSAAVANCISLQSSTCDSDQSPGNKFVPPDRNLWPMNNWTLCFQNLRDANNWAVINFRSSNGHGVFTQITYGKGNPLCAG